MKNWVTRLGLIIVGLLILCTVTFVIWAQFDYQPTREANKYVQEYDGKSYEFGNSTSNVGFILYQGAKVEPGAYSYIGHKLAENGHFVSIPKLPFNIALLNSDVALDIMDDHPSVKRWYLIGHSLGGTAASSIIKEHAERINGIIFLASYPIEKISIPSLTIYGGKDGVLPASDIIENKKNVSSHAQFYKIPEGNHANFGMYGSQKGDNESTLTPKQQIDSSIETIERFIMTY